MTFGEQLRSMRNKMGLTQMQVARLLDCSPPRVSEWERGVRNPKPLTQEAIIARMKNHPSHKGKKK